jgi:hypothetical protein
MSCTSIEDAALRNSAEEHHQESWSSLRVVDQVNAQLVFPANVVLGIGQG